MVTLHGGAHSPLIDGDAFIRLPSPPCGTSSPAVTSTTRGTGSTDGDEGARGPGRGRGDGARDRRGRTGGRGRGRLVHDLVGGPDLRRGSRGHRRRRRRAARPGYGVHRPARTGRR